MNEPRTKAGQGLLKHLRADAYPDEWTVDFIRAVEDEARTEVGGPLLRLHEAFNALWSNGPVIDTIGEWGRSWTSDGDPAFYDLLKECRDAVAALLAAGREAPE